MSLKIVLFTYFTYTIRSLKIYIYGTNTFFNDSNPLGVNKLTVVKHKIKVLQIYILLLKNTIKSLW